MFLAYYGMLNRLECVQHFFNGVFVSFFFFLFWVMSLVVYSSVWNICLRKWNFISNPVIWNPFDLQKNRLKGIENKKDKILTGTQLNKNFKLDEGREVFHIISLDYSSLF